MTATHTNITNILAEFRITDGTKVHVGTTKHPTEITVEIRGADGRMTEARFFDDARSAMANALSHCGWGPLGEYLDDPADDSIVETERTPYRVHHYGPSGEVAAVTQPLGDVID